MCFSCQTCNATGLCASTCNDANGCSSSVCSAAGSLPCSTRVAGWKNGNECHRYASDPAHFCLSTGACSTTTDTNLCDHPPATLVTTKLTICPSAACRDLTKCVVNSDLTLADSVAEICVVNADNAACNPPTTVPCNKFLTGWNGRTCERYSRASSGRCDGTGACITSCAVIPSQTVVPHVSCGNVGCIRPTACVNGSNADSLPSVASLCFTDGARHNCPIGATCAATGDCVYGSDGLPCAQDIDCYSGFCVKPPGVCCNRRCSNECEECLLSSGKCQAKTGEACSFDVRCTSAIKGVNPAQQEQCQRFQNDRKGVCLQSGVCGNTFDLCVGSAGVALQTCGSTSCRKACDMLANVTTADTLAEACYVNTDRPECDDIPCKTLLAGWNSADRTRCDKYAIDHPGFATALASARRTARNVPARSCRARST